LDREGQGKAAKEENRDDEEREQVGGKGDRSDQAPPGDEPFSTNRRISTTAITEVMCLDNYIVTNHRAGDVEPRELTYVFPGTPPDTGLKQTLTARRPLRNKLNGLTKSQGVVEENKDGMERTL